VAKADHHCAWLNNCVGLNNYRHFITFLFATTILCVYGSILVYKLYWHHINQQRLMEMAYTNDQGQKIGVSAVIALQVLI
jgi:palmitoyltransferase